MQRQWCSIQNVALRALLTMPQDRRWGSLSRLSCTLSCAVWCCAVLHLQVCEGMEVTAYYAGHVLGAAMLHVTVGSESLVYTGEPGPATQSAPSAGPHEHHTRMHCVLSAFLSFCTFCFAGCLSKPFVFVHASPLAHTRPSVGDTLMRLGRVPAVSAGDFNTVPERHLAGASIPRLCPDLLISESTYATSIREDRRSRERALLNMVRPASRGLAS